MYESCHTTETMLTLGIAGACIVFVIVILVAGRLAAENHRLRIRARDLSIDKRTLQTQVRILRADRIEKDWPSKL